MIAGCGFLVELSFLGGREKLAGYDVHALVAYESEARAGLLGLGRARSRAVASRSTRTRCCASELGIAGGVVVAAGRAGGRARWRPPALPDGAAASGSPSWREVRDDREARVLRCRGKSYLDLLAQRAGDCASAPDAVVAPGDAAQVAAVLRRVRGGRASRSCRSAAGRASSAAWPASAPFACLARSRPPGPRGLGRPAVADRGLRAGDPAARGGCGAARAGAGARPRAAELRVGDGRRLRGDPLGRPDVDRPRADRRAGRGARVRDAGGLAGDAGRARRAPRARAARAGARLRGDAGRDHAGRAARAAAARGVATTAGASARSWRARSCCASSSRTGSRRTSRGSRTRRRRG